MFLNGSKSGKNTLNPTRYVLVRRKVQLLNDVLSSQIMQNLDVTSVVMPELHYWAEAEKQAATGSGFSSVLDQYKCKLNVTKTFSIILNFLSLQFSGEREVTGIKSCWAKVHL